MRTQYLFYFLGGFIILAFSWWFYSLFNLSRINYYYEKNYLEQKYSSAYLDFIEKTKAGFFKSEDASVYTIDTNSFEIDTSVVKEYYLDKFPEMELSFANTKDALQLLRFDTYQNELAKLDNQSMRKERMWITEGITFFIVLLIGIYWIYSSFAARIEMNNQQRNFLLSITHEFKTPLASLKLYLQTMQKRILEKEQLDKIILNSIKDVERLDELSENVLMATKIEGLGYNYSFTRLNFSELLEETVTKVMHPKLGKFDLIKNIDSNLFTMGDRLTLSLVITNLLENACKYSSEGGKISVVLKPLSEDQFCLRIGDEGPGIPDNEKKKIFRKFYRIGNEDTRKTKGTGLGLFIVKEVSKRHGAKVSIIDNKPQGSIFDITLNRVE